MNNSYDIYDMGDTKHDASSYDCSCYKREIWDCNVLFDAFIKTRRGIGWKEEIQLFEINWLTEICKMSADIKDNKYEFSGVKNFVYHERGKTRLITSEVVRDKIIKHAICDEVLVPTMRKYLIYDNGASLKGKGVRFTRERLETHLHKYYRENGSNKGYILLIDFSKYFDNIRHDILKDLFRKYVDDECALMLTEKSIFESRVDVSYMDDLEYKDCMNEVFNSLVYNMIDKTAMTGEKYMAKHLNIGDQIAQISGVSYTMPIDNYVKIVKGVKYYGRYNDDSYIINSSKEFLEDLLRNIIKIAKNLGITVNTKKTKICKLSEYWRFLQIQYALTDAGRVIKKINPKRLTSMKRKMKKVRPILSDIEFTNWYKSWFKGHYKIMSKRQRENMDNLFEELLNKRY